MIRVAIDTVSRAQCRTCAALLRYRICAALLVVTLAMFACPSPPARARPSPQQVTHAQGCTTFYLFDGRTALAGNNEDFLNPLTYMWFVPAAPGRYGCVYFGYEDGIPQGGLNDQGLFFDGLSLQYKPMPLTSNRTTFPGGDLALLYEVLSRSANVHEAMDILGRWSRLGGEYSQLFYGDRSGDAVIVDGDTVIPRDGAFLLATNFRITDSPDPPYPDTRYGTLKAMFETAQRFDVELCRQALDAAHAEGDCPTLYSQVYELKSGKIHLYQYHDFEHAVVLDLADELAKGPRIVAIESLFPENAAHADWAMHQIGRWRSAFEVQAAAGTGTESQAWMCGDYVLHDAPTTKSGRVYLQGDRLRLDVPGQPAVELLPSSSSTVFHQYVSGMDLTLTFQRNLWGQATGARGTLSFEPYGINVPYDMTRRGVLSYRASLLLTLAGAFVVAAVLSSGAVVARRRALRRSREGR